VLETAAQLRRARGVFAANLDFFFIAGGAWNAPNSAGWLAIEDVERQEILFFGGLFGAYTVYRNLYTRAFVEGSHHLPIFWGCLNTVVLIASSLTVALAGHAGANLVYESAGMLASLLACSFEALVIDNDMLGAVNRTVRGIEITPDKLSIETIKSVIFGAGHFLGQDQTLSLMQSEYIYPQVGDRLSPADWFDAGATSADERARVIASGVLSSHFPAHVSPEIDARVRERFDIRLPAEELTRSSRWG